MTLSSIRADLRRVFSPGQAYVALSRVRKLQDITLEGLPPERMLTPDSRVLSLESSLCGGLQSRDPPKKRRRRNCDDPQMRHPDDATTTADSI